MREGLGTRQFVQPHEKKPFEDLEEVRESVCLPSSTIPPPGEAVEPFFSLSKLMVLSPGFTLESAGGLFQSTQALKPTTPKSPGVWSRYCNFYKLFRGHYCSRIPQSETKEPTQVSNKTFYPSGAFGRETVIISYF